jgi:hypothetical protein
MTICAENQSDKRVALYTQKVRYCSVTFNGGKPPQKKLLELGVTDIMNGSMTYMHVSKLTEIDRYVLHCLLSVYSTDFNIPC